MLTDSQQFSFEWPQHLYTPQRFKSYRYYHLEQRFKQHYLKRLMKSFQLNCEEFNLLRDQSTIVSDTAPGN